MWKRSNRLKGVIHSMDRTILSTWTVIVLSSVGILTVAAEILGCFLFPCPKYSTESGALDKHFPWERWLWNVFFYSGRSWLMNTGEFNQRDWIGHHLSITLTHFSNQTVIFWPHKTLNSCSGPSTAEGGDNDAFIIYDVSQYTLMKIQLYHVTCMQLDFFIACNISGISWVFVVEK